MDSNRNDNRSAHDIQSNARRICVDLPLVVVKSNGGGLAGAVVAGDGAGSGRSWVAPPASSDTATNDDADLHRPIT